MRKALLTVSAIALVGSAGYAQDDITDDAAEPRTLDRVVVTGTNIRGFDYSSPIPAETLDAADIEAAGVITTTDLLTRLTVNTGSEFNTFNFSQNNTAGTSQVNLRGLGLGATLTLLNGRRLTTNASFADDGSTFVDINTIPLLLIDRVEVVKSGSSAIYGSDAVAGVVNFITRDDFKGLDLAASFQTTTEDSQEDLSVDSLIGFGNDSTHITLAASYFNRTPLLFEDRGFTNTGTELENIGNPGSFVLLAPSPLPGLGALPTGAPLPDPNCVAEGGVIQALAPPPAPVGFCLTDSRAFQSLVAEEERISLFGDIDFEFDNGVRLFAEAQYADNATDTVALRSLPGLASPVILPPTNPGNPFGAPAVFIGRPLGIEDGLADGNFRSETMRFAAGAEIPVGAWMFDVSAVHGENEFQTSVNDLLANQVALALAGQAPGGFLNPSTIGPDTPAEVADFITVELFNEFKSETQVVSANFSGVAGRLSGREIGLAVGYQYRQESAALNADDLLNAPAGTLTFLPGVPDFPEASVDVHAAYAELGLPLTERIDVQTAVRYEDYGGQTGDTIDPKIAVGFEVTDALTLRASAGTSFRAPTPLQTRGATAQVTPIVNPCTGQRSAAAVITEGNAALQPEDSSSYAAGVAYEGRAGLRASLDLYRYEYEDIVTRQDPQGIASSATCTQVAPGVIVPVGDGVVLNPQTGQIARIETQFFNAGVIETDGVDINFGYSFDSGALSGLDLDFRATIINSFDLTTVPGGAKIDALDNRNALNFARPTPDLRTAGTVRYETGIHGFGATLRYIDSYDDDLNGDAPIDDYLTVDIQYAVDLTDVTNVGKATRLVFGAINVTDEEPPFVDDRGGYDPLVADPRGRLLYIKIRQAF